MLLSEHRQTPARWTHYLWLNGQPVALVRNNTLYWVQADHLGRPEGITDQNQQRQWRAATRPFDRKVVDDFIGGFHLGFPGQYHDVETGFAYNINRTYMPAVGRYLETDPIGLAGGINTYAYALNNPVMNTDPMGLEAMGPWNNGQMSNVAGGADPCAAMALGSFVLDSLPVIGAVRALNDPELAPGWKQVEGFGTTAWATGEILLPAWERSTQAEISRLEEMYSGKQRLRVARLEANFQQSLIRGLRIGSRITGAAGLGANFYSLGQELKKCGCK